MDGSGDHGLVRSVGNGPLEEPFNTSFLELQVKGRSFDFDLVNPE